MGMLIPATSSEQEPAGAKVKMISWHPRIMVVDNLLTDEVRPLAVSLLPVRSPSLVFLTLFSHLSSAPLVDSLNPESAETVAEVAGHGWQECEHMIKLAEARLEPSTVVNVKDGSSIPSTVRSSCESVE
jgi:hypothetical protein